MAISVDIWRGSGIQHQIGERVHCGAHIVGIGCRDGQHLVEEGVVALGQRNIIELLCVCLAQLVIGVYNTLDIGIVFDALYRGQASDRIDDGLLQTKDFLPLLGVGTSVFCTAVENIKCTAEIAGVGVILRQQHGNCVGFHA